jgi:hypothetical protein
MMQSHNMSSERDPQAQGVPIIIDHAKLNESGILIFNEADNLMQQFYPPSRPTSGVQTIRGLSPAASRPD